MKFNGFEDIKENSNNSGVARLAGNEIHTVKFLGCEARDIQGVQDASKVFNVLEIKFSNADGTFTHTIWEPREEDYQDTDNSFGGKNPSNMLSIQYLISHLLNAVCPDWDPKIFNLEAPDYHTMWLKLRKAVVEASAAGIGTETKIKLLTNNKGEATFPSFFLSYNRENKPYMRTSFIGKTLVFTEKERNRIKQQTEAKPTPMTLEIKPTSKKPLEDAGFDDAAAEILKKPASDIDFDI